MSVFFSTFDICYCQALCWMYTLFHFIQLQEVRTFIPHVQEEIQFSLNGSILVGVGAEERQWQGQRLLSQRGLSLNTSSSSY